MRKIGFYRIIFLTVFFVLTKSGAGVAQSFYLEFKCGGVASSPFNSSAPEKKPDLKHFQKGVAAFVGFGYEYPNEFLRLYSGIYYLGKGEKYPMNEKNVKQFNSYMSYFQFCPEVRAYISSGLFYFSLGGYIGYCFKHNITSGDMLDQRGELRFIQYYKKFDLGPRAAFGMEIGLKHIRGTLELSYEYGLQNISNRKERTINNQCLLLTLGANVKIVKKDFRPY